MALGIHRTFVLFGPSGAGKGTQAKLLVAHLGSTDTERQVLHLSTGVLFRTFMETGTLTAHKVGDLLEEGSLLPEFLPIWLWTGYLNEHINTNTEHIIFDGVARRFAEAPVLRSALEFYGREKTTDVIVITVSREWAAARLKERGRYDDTDEDIRRRLDWYEKEVRKSIDYFRNDTSCRVHDINGEQSIEAVHSEIKEKVGI